jgi:hypothetical protein
MIRPHLRYASYVARHKWFVFRAGLRTKAPLWRLLVHDLSKLTPGEWRPYVETFYGTPPGDYWLRAHYGGRPNVEQNRIDWEADCQARFDRAWLHHQHHNPHHWQHWVLTEDGGSLKALRMPGGLVREMVADWMGAGRAITGRWDVASWWAENERVVHLHPDTRRMVDRLIAAAPTSRAMQKGEEGTDAA